MLNYVNHPHENRSVIKKKSVDQNWVSYVKPKEIGYMGKLSTYLKMCHAHKLERSVFPL